MRLNTNTVTNEEQVAYFDENYSIIKGFIFNLVISKPLKNPNNNTIIKPAMQPIMILRSELPVTEKTSFIVIAEVTADRANKDPTDKSNPPDIITRV